MYLSLLKENKIKILTHGCDLQINFLFQGTLRRVCARVVCSTFAAAAPRVQKEIPSKGAEAKTLPL